MMSFDLRPFEGAAPILFGMPKVNVVGLIGPPKVAGGADDSWGPHLEINIGYGNDGRVNHLGFSPGEFELRLSGALIWNATEHEDPNPMFLQLDPEPVERVGFLVFRKLGLTTTGYHDDDPSQYAITAFPPGAWDKELTKAKPPHLTKYGIT
jgi:hypothetical protein